MTRIRVNPDQLIKKGDEILKISVQMKSIARAVFDSASSAPGYHDFFRGDQFGHEVFELGQNAFNMGTTRVNQLEDHYKEIVLRAAAFIGADTESDLSMQFADTSNINVLLWLFLLEKGYTTQQILAFLKLGSLFSIVALPLGLIGEFVLWLKKRQFEKVAERVQSGVRGKVDLTYPRNGYNGVQSNCTWYVAQAVYEASNQNVKLENWHNATDWLKNAKEYLRNNPNGFISGIDTSPKPGDVMHFNCGHVAYVEKVETIDGKTYITWTEENATGKCSWGSANPEKVEVDGKEILRWRCTRELDSKFMDTYDIQFIHINYDYQGN